MLHTRKNLEWQRVRNKDTVRVRVYRLTRDTTVTNDTESRELNIPWVRADWNPMRARTTNLRVVNGICGESHPRI